MEQLAFLREDAARSERWASITEGLEGERKGIVETLLDNTQRLISEETDSSAVAVFTKIAKPLIRRIFPALVANSLVSIQPMSMPTTKVFYLDFVASNDNAPTVKGDRLDWEAGLRNNMYSSGVIKGELLGTGTASRTTFNTKTYPLKADSTTVYVDSTIVTGFTVDETTGAIVFGAAPANGASIRVDYALDLEHMGSRGNTETAGIELTMSSATVEAEEKRLKARWSVNAAQDFAAYGFGSVESEMTKQLGDQVRREIDGTIISDLYSNATAGNVTWSKAVPTGIKLSDHYETLMHAIADASMDIYRKRLRHANFVVCSPDTINMLDKTNRMVLASGMSADGQTNTAAISSGANVFGTLSSRYTVVTDPSFPSNKILVGYKGADWNETGYVYAPYTAVQTDTWTDPNTMKPVKGLATRYGRHLVNGDFYATVTIAS